MPENIVEMEAVDVDPLELFAVSSHCFMFAANYIVIPVSVQSGMPNGKTKVELKNK